MTNHDEYWIDRCIKLAKRGRGYTSPNPLVGAILVKNNTMISSGYHKHYGGPHAEINAINSALLHKHDIRNSTLYVNLEPCFHYGKTPPCVDAIIKYGIGRVVISTIDPNPLVSGRSITKLRRNGIHCSVGIGKADALSVNEKFIKFIQTGYPFVSIKAAQTADGFIARTDSSSQWITNTESRTYGHFLRSEYDAILVGAKTIINDNPRLTVRKVRGRNPLRIVIDGRLRSDVHSKVFDASASTIVYTSSESKSGKIKTLRDKNVAVVPLPGRNGTISPHSVLQDLARHQITSVLIEGGQHIYGEFINARLVNKIYLFTAPKRFKKGLYTFGSVINPIRITKKSQRFLGTDLFEEMYIA